MKHGLLLATALLAASAAGGADLKLPSQVQGDPGTFIKVPATTSAKAVGWYVMDPGLALYPPELQNTTLTAVVTASQAGSYRLLAFVDASTPPAVCTVVIGTPGPQPGPPPPPPSDPFTQAVQAAYKSEVDAGKAQEAAFLASVFQGGAALLTPDVTTYSALFAKLKSAIRTPGLGIPQGALPNVMKVVEADLTQAFGTDPTRPLDPVVVKATFAKYATALGTLKGVK